MAKSGSFKTVSSNEIKKKELFEIFPIDSIHITKKNKFIKVAGHFGDRCIIDEITGNIFNVNNDLGYEFKCFNKKLTK